MSDIVTAYVGLTELALKWSVAKVVLKSFWMGKGIMDGQGSFFGEWVFHMHLGTNVAICAQFVSQYLLRHVN